MADMTTSNVKATAVKAFFEGLITPNDSVITEVLTYEDVDAPALRKASLTGIPDPGTWTAGDDLPSAAITSEGAVTMDYQAYGVSVDINPYDVMDVPGIVEKSANKLGRSVANKRAKLAFTLLQNMFTDDSADGVDIVSDQHTTAAGGSNYRNNKLTSALDISSFNAAIRKCREWLNFQGQSMDWADVRKFLIVPPALEMTARQVLGSPYQLTTIATTEVGSGGHGVAAAAPSQGLMNPSGLYNTVLIVDPYATDDNNWSLVAEPSYGNPFTFWDRQKPQFFAAVEDQDSLKVKLRCHWASIAKSGPEPDGVIGSLVS